MTRQRLKIAHAAPSLSRGGGERLMIELANAAVAQGHEVTVLLAFQVPLERRHTGLDPRVNVQFVGPGEKSKLRRYLSLLPWLWHNRRWLSSQDVLHCHMTYGAVLGTLALIITRSSSERRPAIVETYHAVGMPMPRLLRWLHTRMASTRDGLAFMVEHEHWRPFIARRPGLNARIIPAGITVSDFAARDEAQRREYRRRIGVPDHCCLVGTLGRLVPERRPWEYLPVFQRVAQKIGPDVHFVMGGDGPEEARIRALIRECGLQGRVHLPGLVDDLQQFFVSNDLFLTMNMGAVPGVAGLQAIAAGVSVISIQFDTYDGAEENWVWASADPEKVAEKAVELLEAPQDRAALGQRQFDHLLKEHSAEGMARAYDRFYEESLKRLTSERGAGG